MNILYTETLRRWGGQQNRVLQQAIGLTRKGHDNIIACHKGSILAQRAKEAGIRTYEINMSKAAYPVTIPRLISIILKEKTDIICTNSSVDSWAGGAAALFTGRKLVRYKHNLYRVKKDPPTRFIYSRPHRFITVSDAASGMLLNAGHVRPEKIRRVYGGIDTEEFRPGMIGNADRIKLKRSLGIPENSLVIGNTSGFTGIKGQPYLLEACDDLFRKTDNIYLLLPGRLGRKEKVTGLVAPEFQDRVILPGYRTDIPRLLSIMDIFVFPSTVEAFGYSLIEAMAMTRPVVVSDIPSFREFVVDKNNGIFFRTGDSGSLLAALYDIIEKPEEWQSLGNNARKTVIERFKSDRMFDEIEDIYLSLMNE